MNTLLIFFALPIATIILAIVLEKLLRCPVLTAATFFAIYLIVAFAIFDASFLVFVIVYTVLAYITAVIAEFFFTKCKKKVCISCNCNANNNIELSNEAAQNIAARVANILNNTNNNCNSCCNCNNNSIATINVRNPNGEQTTWCCRRK